MIPASFGKFGVALFLRSGTSIRSKAYTTLSYALGPSPRELTVVYETFANTLTAVRCSGSPSGTVRITHGWNSPSGHVALLPSLALSHVPNGGPFGIIKVHVTYWDNNAGGSPSQLTLMAGNPLAASSSTPLLTETPCPFKTYWGDYDEMFVQNDGLANARVWRAFTDSTARSNPGTDWSSSVPQHVSITSYAP